MKGFRHGFCIRCGHTYRVVKTLDGDASLCLSCVKKQGRGMPMKSGSIKELRHR